MSPLRRMHDIDAADPRAEVKFSLFMSELHYRYNAGIERLHIGRATRCKPCCPVRDECAASLQPCVAPGTMNLQAPLEANGRGVGNAHGKGHSCLGPTMPWLGRSVVSGFSPGVAAFRSALIGTATTVGYEAARGRGVSWAYNYVQSRSPYGSSGNPAWSGRGRGQDRARARCGASSRRAAAPGAGSQSRRCR